MEAINKIAIVSASSLAEYILQKYGPMSQLKLQKLLYYCEGYHLAYFDSSVVNEEFEAWMHGPVCPAIFHKYKDQSLIYSDFRYTGSGDPEAALRQSLASEQFDYLNSILSELSTWTGPELEASTHMEKPWLEARVGFGEADRCNVIIKKSTMKDYYKAELNGVQ